MLSKCNYVTACIGDLPYEILSRSCFYCPKLITVAPETRDKEICQIPSEAEYPVEPFEWGLPCCLSLMFLASP